MKCRLVVYLVVLSCAGLLFQPACKSEDDCDFSILGTWNITL